MIEETVSLGEVCEILDTLRKPITKKFRKQGQYPYYGATGIVDYVDNYIFDETLVLIGEDGAKWDKGDQTAFIVSGKYWVNNHAHVIRPLKDKLNQKFLVYYLNSIDLKPWVTGLTVPKLNQEKLKSIPIPLFTIENQQLIVAKLDLAFAKIDNSVLINKNKLSSLRTIEKKIINKLILKNGSDFVKRPIYSLFNLSSGKFLPRKKMNLKGKIKVYGGNGITGYHDTFNLENENILIGRVGAYCGNVYYTNEKIWLTDNCLHINSYKYDFDKQFLSMLLSNLNIRTYAHQAAQPAISYTSLKDIELIFPKSIHEQTIIFKKYIDLKSSFNNLNNNYESQMMSLKKLKLSIFNKAIFNEAA